MSIALTGCATTSTTGDSGSSLPGSLPGSMPGGTAGTPTTGNESGSGAESGSKSEGGSASDDARGAATTADERSGKMEKSLDDSLGEFDKTLDEEQRRTAEARDAQTAARTASGTPEDARGEGGIGRRDGDLRSERSAKNGTSGAESSGDTRDRGTVSGGGSGAPDRGIPSGEDDDIVARRLRRAAEQETDPELKEKLWKEYMEYKRNAQGKG